MASIYHHKAFSNITSIASPKNIIELENVDKELHEEGVRPGQVWILQYGDITHYISFIGYHEKGFVIVNLCAEEESPIPSMSLFNFPRKLKMKLLDNIKNDKAIMLSCVNCNIVDKNGESLPGREMDVTLASLMTSPAYWHDHDKNKNYFLSICKKGHHRVTLGYLPSGEKCDEFCFNAAHTESMSALSDIAFDKIYYGTNNISTFELKNLELDNIKQFVASWSYVEKLYDTKKIICANKTGVKRNHITPDLPPEETHWTEQTKKWLEKNKINSGQIFKLKCDKKKDEKDYNIRLHLKSCGYLHAEITNKLLFTGETETSILKTIASNNGAYKLNIGKNINIELDKLYQFVKCPHCDSKNPVICISERRLKDEKYKNVIPVCSDMPSTNKLARPGDIVEAKGMKALYIKDIRTKHSGTKAMLMTKNKKFVNIPYAKIKISKDSSSYRKYFVDDNNILKRNFRLSEWHRLIIPGSKMKINPLTKNKNIKNIAGFNVTAISFPFISNNRPAINIIESSNIIYLDTDVVICNTFPIEKDMHIMINETDMTINKIENGTVVLAYQKDKANNTLKVPEASIHLAIERQKAMIIENNTVDNLLAEL